MTVLDMPLSTVAAIVLSRVALVLAGVFALVAAGWWAYIGAQLRRQDRVSREWLARHDGGGTC